MPNMQYFLGGNTPGGFYSLYHQLSDPARMRALYIVKGGPGSGKSTLMRRVERHAQAAGLETQQILCWTLCSCPSWGPRWWTERRPRALYRKYTRKEGQGQGPYFFFSKKKHQKETFDRETAFRLGFNLEFPGDRHVLLTRFRLLLTDLNAVN